MFIWAEGPESLDMEALYWKAVEKKVAYVPGKYFYTFRGEGTGTMRLNFTMADENTIDQAIRTLAGVIRQEM
jgi:2-aminoadipate transaminase